MACLNPVLLSVPVSTDWTTQYGTGFMMCGLWGELDPSYRFWFQMLGVVQILLCFGAIFVRDFINGPLPTVQTTDRYNNLGQRSVPNSSVCDRFYQMLIVSMQFSFTTKWYERLSNMLQWAWQGFLGALFVLAPSYNFSGVFVAMIFFHAVMEYSLFWLRIVRLCQSVTMNRALQIISLSVLPGVVLFMLTDNPVWKAIITSPTALISDIGNIVVMALIIRQSVVEKSPSIVTNCFYLFFAVFHVVVFYTPLILVCIATHLTTWKTMFALYSINLAALSIFSIRSIYSKQ
jgi:hypothetical protein